MGISDLFRPADINHGVRLFRSTPGATLLDVRTEQEYREGHIPGSKNVPLHQLDKVEDVAENKDGALFVYCYSGARSGGQPRSCAGWAIPMYRISVVFLPISAIRTGKSAHCGHFPQKNTSERWRFL